jgi:NAD(P)-dependent dehydrogenase (short-subunit alcohol dehydrogenase family)
MPADTLSLTGKVAIVSGSGRENGIGAAIAIALARNGAAVTINYVSEATASRSERLAETIRNAGGKATVVRADVASPEGAKKLVDETMKAFSTDHIDIVGQFLDGMWTRERTNSVLAVNNAGYSKFHTTMKAEKEFVEHVFSVNVNGPIFLTQAAIPHIAAGGRIINISSVASKLGLQYLPIYGASKAALDSLTYAWALEARLAYMSNRTPY